MKRVQLAIYQEILAPILISLLVLTFVVFTREFGRLAELLIRQDADLVTVGRVVVYLLPSILVFTVPFSVLIGTLIGFSRLSSESEIVALRAGGISIMQMLVPLVTLGAGSLLLTALLTVYLLPWGNWELRQLRHQIRATPVQAQISPRVFYEGFPGIILYVEDINLGTSEWRGILLADRSENEERLIVARQGSSLLDPDNNRLQIHFEGGAIYSKQPGAPERDSLSQFGTHDLVIQLPPSSDLTPRPKRPADRNLEDILKDLRLGTSDQQRTSLVELHRRLALPAAALLFALAGVTFGIRSHRGGRAYGIIVSIVIAFSYYILFAAGSTLSAQGALPVPIGVWGANLLMLLVTLLSLRQAEYGTDSALGMSRLRQAVHLLKTARPILERPRERLLRVKKRLRQRAERLPRLRFRPARVVDLYLTQSFLLYFLLALGVCVSLFYLFTFFELVDDIFANQVPYSHLVDYFYYLLPHILMLLIPISFLIGTLITFGALQKTNQIMALKSCGISVYHLAVPILALGLLVSLGVFVLEEYILPYSNQQQDNLRRVIKGSPVQTVQPGRSWIFGTQNRLYNYDVFNPDRNLFSGFSVYEVDLSQSRLISHVYAERASWNRITQNWRLEQGWRRDLKGQGFSRFEESFLAVEEKPDYFDQEVQATSKMTYLELANYIADLQRGGFEVDYLKTALYKKLSFPVVSVIMAILGIPFALTMGRKGALSGIAAGVLIGILYWGAYGVFDVLGANGLLAPALAAWAPNLIFGAGGVLMLSAVRT